MAQVAAEISEAEGSPLRQVLDEYRAHAKTNREAGSYFEALVVAYLRHDDIQKQLYDEVLPYAEWARQRGEGDSARDTGIDLVARIRGTTDEWCAIQCKFFAPEHRIQRSDIDSFFVASGRRPFTRRVLIDTTDSPLGKNAEALFRDAESYIPVHRIGLSDIETSRIDWTAFAKDNAVRLIAKKRVRPDQQEALEAIDAGFKKHDRGKVIMACGTGKTFISMCVAEAQAGAGGRVLFLVPSLALMAQSVTAWSNDSHVPLRTFAVCSDAQVGKRVDEEGTDLVRHDLAFPATTNGTALAREACEDAPDKMTVVFATYQSIQAITEAQAAGLPEFDLIVCDEAHRTTGVTLAEDEDESNFVRVHDNAQVAGRKRLYMTATPRIYAASAKKQADEGGHEVASMDDESKFGPLFFHRGFAWAVENGHLSDYRVIILAMDEGLVSRGVQRALSSEANELRLDDATRIVGCYKALMKEGLSEELVYDRHPMRRALAFCRDIRSSKLVASEFNEVVDEYHSHHNESVPVQVSVHHVDGTFGAKARTRELEWLKSAATDECRVLSNARCLSEGVDVPALDAILFLHPRKSQIDVVQSVGRVMRTAHGKKMGYVILPVGVPEGVAPEQALNDNKRYKVVWQILNALRAHDERLDATINQAALGEDISGRIQILGIDREELRAVTDTVEHLPGRGTPGKDLDIGGRGDSEAGDTEQSAQQKSLDFNAEIVEAIKARLVRRCGTREYWEDWANDIAEIAQRHVQRIETTLQDEDSRARQTFDDFLTELRDDLNDQITEMEAIEMLAQHLITRPVFDVLFEGNTFAKDNPVSRAIERVLSVLDEHRIDKEARTLERFYASVRRRANGIKTSAGKQRLVVELYNKFFSNAFPRLRERLGIVYTPIEIVDFIIRSVNDVLVSEFDATLGSEGVHIIDPFTGTGTFITRLLQSGLIEPQQLAYKYRNEIHANEIVLLAYYIAGINIEAVFHEQQGGEYQPFPGICLTDTFAMYEGEDMVSKMFEDNSERRKRQKKLDIRVIMANPPYAYKQSSANDNNQVIGYPELDEKIRKSYVAHSGATRNSAVYNSYIRAICWGSERLKEKGGVMAYVTDASWIDGNAMAGVRHCLAEEFSSLYVFHLRGNQRAQDWRREGGKVFGEGSQSAIAITVFVKNPAATEHGRIYFHDIGDYLSREEKLGIVGSFGSIQGIANSPGWKTITPNAYSDWLNQRDDGFYSYLPMGDKKAKKGEVQLFENYSGGIVTSRDAWAYNPSKIKVESNMACMIAFYNDEVERYIAAGGKEVVGSAKGFADKNPKKISWDRIQYQSIERGRQEPYKADHVVPSLYRPFSRSWLYFDGFYNNCVYQMPKIFPTAGTLNRVIAVAGVGAGAEFSPLIANAIPNFHFVDTGQCFPHYLYEPIEDDPSHMPGWNDASASEENNASEGIPPGYRRRHGITDAGLAHAQEHYPGERVTKDDVFYYIYGLLHSPDYRTRFANNLSRALPRIPFVRHYEDFDAFAAAGRKLADLHADYEQVAPFDAKLRITHDRALDELSAAEFRVDKKWKFGGKRGAPDRTVVHYNAHITITGIPEQAYEYVVNGKPALNWVMERQVVKTDKASGIVSDANDYAVETMGDAAYPLRLFLRVVTVSLETMKIVRGLPALDIE